MLLYRLKRYHALQPAKRAVWHLGREIAFEAPTDADAIKFAEKRDPKDLGYARGLLMLVNSAGAIIWDKEI